MIKVIPKSGNLKQPQNYRPIAVIPLLYKLFSRLLYNRLEPILDAAQTADQAGFRRKFSTVDHIFTMGQLREKASEFQLPLWVATLDFKKAFDTVSHDSLWNALLAQHTPPAYVTLLARLYDGQTASVKTDTMSRSFQLQRGTKQGDPLSSLLFNCFSEHIFRQVLPVWKRRGCGIRLRPNSSATLTNLRFADDVLLFATSLPQLTRMLHELSTAALAVGLELHPDKTKILHNHQQRKPRQQPEYAKVGALSVEVLPYTGKQKYLGTQLTFHCPNATEVESRISAAWKRFHAMKGELTNRKYSLKSRIRLFHGAVTPMALYASGTWTMKVELEHRLQKTQRQMLRMILNTPRRKQQSTPPAAPEHTRTDTNNSPTGDLATQDSSDEAGTASNASRIPSCQLPDETLELWVDWIKRCTRQAENVLQDLGINDWVTLQRQQKVALARRIESHSHDRWTIRSLEWDPEADPRLQAKRKPHRPAKRWSDGFTDADTSI